MSLFLTQCFPDPVALAAFAQRNRLVPPGGDPGYAVHALLGAAFGAAAPRPFRLFESGRGLLAYSQASPESLQAHAELAPPDVHRALGLGSLQGRAVPSAWPVGRLLGFEVRVRPVIRTRDQAGRVRERDALLHAIEQPNATREPVDREQIYRRWLQVALLGKTADGAGPTASLLECRMTSMRRTRVFRRTQGDAGERKIRCIEGPDAAFEGVLRIEHSEAFSALLGRGLGRHRAFGFGMLLLKPI